MYICNLSRELLTMECYTNLMYLYLLPLMAMLFSFYIRIMNILNTNLLAVFVIFKCIYALFVSIHEVR